MAVGGGADCGVVSWGEGRTDARADIAAPEMYLSLINPLSSLQI